LKQALAPVISNSEVMPGTRLIWLESPLITATARPGQFVMVRCGEDTLLRRPLSVHQADGGKIALLFTIAGRGTHWLSQRQTGETVDIFGPLGNGYTIYPDSKNLLLVAGGMGIAPLRFLADEAIEQGRNITLALGHTQGVSLNLLVKQILEVKNEASENKVGARIVPVSEDGTYGTKGLVTNTMKKLCPKADQIFACGPVGMYQTMAQMPELRNKPVQVSLEIMMGCGVGVCYGCTVKTKSGLSELDNINWDELRGV